MYQINFLGYSKNLSAEPDRLTPPPYKLCKTLLTSFNVWIKNFMCSQTFHNPAVSMQYLCKCLTVPLKCELKKEHQHCHFQLKHISIFFQTSAVCGWAGQQGKTGAQMIFRAAKRRWVGVFVHIPGSHSSCWQVVLSCLLALPASHVYVLDFSPSPSLSKYFLMPLRNVLMLWKQWSGHIQYAGSLFPPTDTACRGYIQLVILFLLLTLDNEQKLILGINCLCSTVTHTLQDWDCNSNTKKWCDLFR